MKGPEWLAAPFGELPLEIIDGDRSANYPKRSEFVPEGVPFLNSTNIHEGHFDATDLNFISEEKAASIKKGRAKPGDIVMTTRGSIGKVAVFPSIFPVGVINAQMLLVRSDPGKLDQLYLFHVMRGPEFQGRVRSFASGSAQPQIPIRDLKHVPVLLPPIPIQQRIAAILSSYDDLIENNTRRIAILEEMARRLYEQWFVHFRVPKDFKTTHQEGSIWPTTRFGDHADVTDYVANGSFASLKANVTYHSSPEFAILVRTKDHNQGWKGDFVYVDESSFDFLKKSELTVGDIVVSNVGNVGVVFRVPDLGRPTTLGPNAVRVRPKANSDFFFHLLSGNIGQGLLASISSGAAQQKFNKTELRNLQIPWPEPRLQKMFCEAVAPIELQKETLRKSNANLRAQRDLLLPKLVSGEIDVSEAEATLEAAE